jgi:hypothetical protein
MYLVGAIEKFGRMSKQGRLMSCGPNVAALSNKIPWAKGLGQAPDQDRPTHADQCSQTNGRFEVFFTTNLLF